MKTVMYSIDIHRCGIRGVINQANATYQQSTKIMLCIDNWQVGKEKLKSVTTNTANTAKFAKELLGLNVEPVHITGIVVRKLS